MFLHAAIGIEQGRVDNGPGTIGDDARGVDLVRGVVIVFDDNGLVLGQELVAHVEVILHAGVGGVILGQQLAVEGVDVVGSGVIGGESGISSCRFHFDRRAHGIGAAQAHIVVIDIRNFLTFAGQCGGIDIRETVIGLNREDNGEWLLQNREGSRSGQEMGLAKKIVVLIRTITKI